MQDKQGDFYIILKAKDKWISDLLEANAFMLSVMRENGLSMPQGVIDAEIPPEERIAAPIEPNNKQSVNISDDNINTKGH